MHSASQRLKIVMAENVAIKVTEHKIKTNNLLLFCCYKIVCLGNKV
jgi:hypothetical protein